MSRKHGMRAKTTTLVLRISLVSYGQKSRKEDKSNPIGVFSPHRLGQVLQVDKTNSDKPRFISQQNDGHIWPPLLSYVLITRVCL